MTQADLAAGLGVSLGSVGNWESGENPPSPAMLRKLADFFKVSIDFFSADGYAETTEHGSVTGERTGEDHYYQIEEGQAVIPKDCPDPKCFAVEFEGDSMEPKYQRGDVLMISPNSHLANGDLVLAKTVGEDLYFKIYHRVGPQVLLSSYNPAYPPLELDVAEFRFIYPVWSVLRQIKKRGQAVDQEANGKVKP